jgi:single-stranded-DNA-specific exonuclease
MLTTNWVKKASLPATEEIKENFPNPWIQQLLARNNINSLIEARKFLDPDYYIPSPPSEIPDLEVAAQRLIVAINQKQKIGIWGDFDVDGQTSTTLLFQGLSTLGADVIYYIPIRAKESHGINLTSLIEFLKNDISVLLTCDTGISEIESVEYAMKQGVDVLITDHHTLPDILPDAMAKVNPQRLPENHPLRNLSGVGVAFKLMEYLYQQFNLEGQTEELLDLVALGTVADVAILTADNRYLVQKGLKKLQEPKRLGLQEIYKNKNFRNGQINEMHIGFYLAPLLNALGRLSDANPIVEFLTTNNLQKAQVFAGQLENLNEKRKLITDQITDAVLSQLDLNQTLLNEPSIIMHHPDWEPGVLGIVANRLVEKYHKPTILLTGDEDSGYFGSARSIDKLNIIETIRKNSSFLNHFGGHAMAAGLSMKAENFQPFKNNFNKTIIKTIGDSILEKELKIDGYINFDVIDLPFVKEIESFAPFGAGNPAPIFASKNVVIEKLQKIGKKSEHLKIKALDASENFQELIWWRADIKDIPEEKIDIAYTLQSSNYKGQESVQIQIVEIKPGEEVISEIQATTEKIRFVDFRLKPPKDSNWINDFSEFVWFEEGLTKNFSDSINRQTLIPSETLILYTIPPNLSELKKILFTVRPKNLILFGNSPFPLSINQSIKTVAGMLKFIANNNNGLFHPHDLAIATGHRQITIESMCRFLHVAGQITLSEHPDTQWLVKIGGVRETEKVDLYKNNIEWFYRETIAFHKWYKNLDVNKFKDTVLGTN